MDRVCDKCQKILDQACRDKTVWYGYVHVNGSRHVKRIASTADWQEAFDSDFVKKITRPFITQGREQATEIFKEIIEAHDLTIRLSEYFTKMVENKVIFTLKQINTDFTCEH
jgi:hypothetical protein